MAKNSNQFSITQILTASFILIYSCFFLFARKHQNAEMESKYSQQYKTVDELLDNLSKNDTLAVRKMIGVNNLNSIGRDDHGLNFDVKELSELIKLFGFPDKNKYKLTEYPRNAPELLDFGILLLDRKNKSLRKATLNVKFVKYLPSNKILDFKLDEEYQNDHKLIDSVRSF